MIKFEDPTIDLIRTYDEYENNCGSNKPWQHTFGFSIVDLAINVIGGWPYEEHLIGIRKCLVFEISKLKKQEYLWKFRAGYSSIGDDIKIYDNQKLLVDSLMFSVIEFNDHLHEHATGMSKITRLKLRRGFELACLWACEAELLNPDKNGLVITRNNEKYLKYISTGHERMNGRNQ